MSELVHLPVLFVKQRITMMVNRYEILAANPDGSIGRLLRSTFHIEGPGYQGTGQERNELIAVLRRVGIAGFLPFHVDFVATDGALLPNSERQWSLRDKYTVTVPDPRVDFRVAAAMAVGPDALLGR